MSCFLIKSKEYLAGTMVGVILDEGGRALRVRFGDRFFGHAESARSVRICLGGVFQLNELFKQIQMN
jgi:hypothetical protein